MARIRVTPERVREVSQQFKSASGQSQELVSKLQSTINNLNSEWEGMTQQKFYSDFQNWQQNMRQFVELLNQISKQLDAIAQRFAQADQQG